MTLKSATALVALLAVSSPARSETPPSVSAVMLGGRVTAAVLRSGKGDMRILRVGDAYSGGVVRNIDSEGIELGDGRRYRLAYVRPANARRGSETRKVERVDLNLHVDVRPNLTARDDASDDVAREESIQRARAIAAANAVFANAARPLFLPTCNRPSASEFSFPAAPLQSAATTFARRPAPSPCE